LTGVEVVDAVAGSGVDDAGALIERDVGCENAGDLQRQKGMLKICALEMVALELGEDARFLDVALGLECKVTRSAANSSFPFRFRRRRTQNLDEKRARDCAEWSRSGGSR